MAVNKFEHQQIKLECSKFKINFGPFSSSNSLRGHSAPMSWGKFQPHMSNRVTFYWLFSPLEPTSKNCVFYQFTKTRNFCTCTKRSRAISKLRVLSIIKHAIASDRKPSPKIACFINLLKDCVDCVYCVDCVDCVFYNLPFSGLVGPPRQNTLAIPSFPVVAQQLHIFTYFR